MNKNLKTVKDHGLFVGSGVESIVDSGTQTNLNQYGQYEPQYSDNDASGVEKVTLNAQESRNENDISDTIFSGIRGIKQDEHIGYYLKLYAGHTIEGEYRARGSSGGLVSWVASKMLEAGMVDGFIHVVKSKKPGILFEYGISRTTQDIQAGSKSRYYPAELSSVLKEVKKTPGTYTVIGIPEIITEVRLLAENDPDIAKRIKYYFGLVCGHQKTTKYAEAIAWEYGIEPGDLESIDFRVKKDSGQAIEYDMVFTGKTKHDGKTKTYTVRNNEPFVSSWAHGFFKARFSDFTDNTFNENADITFGDAWLDEYNDDPHGNNIVIVRNKALLELLKKGMRDAELKLDAVSADTIKRSQQGLIHHTRDELPYRLQKEQEAKGWTPHKRYNTAQPLTADREKVQDIRQQIAKKSHIYYKQAIDRGDFAYFVKKMQPLVNKYKDLYKQPYDTTKPVKADGAILTLTGYFNYGNVLQRYALQKFLRNNGYKFVSYVDRYSAPRDIYPVNTRTTLEKIHVAIKRFFNYEKPYWYRPTYNELFTDVHGWENIIEFVNRYIWIKPFNPNDTYKTYIVGSDQVWRNWWGDREKVAYYFLNFLKGRKANRIAYAASFGKDTIEDVMSHDDIEYVRPYVETFDHISVREATGKKILKQTWGRNDAVEVVDPTLLLSADEYTEIIDANEKVRHEKIQPMFSYILGETPEIRTFIRRLQDKRQQAITRIRAHAGSEDDILPPVELWLKGFRDAELVITNSFHGMMFAIINNTDFIIIGKEAGGLARIKDFLKKYGIVGRLVEEGKLDQFDIANLKPIDWQEMNAKRAKYRTESGRWLLESLK
ncbi:hypothetical protein CSA80_03580 [Candidatus Saccharibacteria bacterium]|nr:MAG: hypothetical protein CSA80_03580 [Candidatus Saccharibacteria bacterium]